jgi:hypothetical protein
MENFPFENLYLLDEIARMILKWILQKQHGRNILLRIGSSGGLM